MQSNFVALLNSEIQLNLFENWKLKTKKVSQNNFEKPPPKPNYIYENYYSFVNSKNKATSTSLATPAPVGSYLML